MRNLRIILGLAVVICVSGCGQRPRIDVSVSIDDGRVAFDIPRRDVNGLLSFRVEDLNGKVLWQINVSYELGQRIIYGVLPTGGNMDAKQVIPSDGKAPPDIRGHSVRVIVEYQYDELMAPSAADFEKTVQVP